MRTQPAGRAALTLVLSYAVLLGVVLGVGWLLTHPLAHSVGTGENGINRWLAARRTPELTDAAAVGRFLGQTWVGEIAVGILGLGFAVAKRSPRPLLFALLTYAGIGGAYFAGTHLDPRARPPVRLLDTRVVADRSFPSGHVGTATAIVLCAGLLLVAYRVVVSRWLLVLGVVPLFVLWARLYQGDHHLTDVLTALVTALVWGTVCARQLLPRADATG